MTQTVHEFIVRRRDEEIELKASFEVTLVTETYRRPRAGHRLPNIDPVEGGHAVLDGGIFLVDSGLLWDGRLTKKELDRVENDVWEAYMDSETDKPGHHRREDAFFVDNEFDDGFDVGMALSTAGRGEMFW